MGKVPMREKCSCWCESVRLHQILEALLIALVKRDPAARRKVVEFSISFPLEQPYM